MANQQATAEQPKKKEKLDPALLKVALVLVFGALASQLDSTMVNVAIKSLTTDLKSTVAAIQWVVTGYVLAMGLAVPVSGWAMNRFGGKKVYLFSLGLFLGGSILCSLSWNAGSLIGFRVLQGIAAGLLIPTMQNVLIQSAGSRNLGRLISIIGIPALLGPILGPVLGGLIVDDLSWRWIFYVNIPITLIGLWLAWKVIPADKLPKTKPYLDLLGLLMLSPAFALLIYGISEVSVYRGIQNGHVFIPVLISVLLLIAFTFHALRTKKTPVLDLRLFKSRHFLASNLTIFLTGLVMNGALLLLPLYYQQVRGESVMHTGLLLIPQGIGMLLTRSWIGGMSDRIGSRNIVIISLLVTLVATLPFAYSGIHTSYVLLSVAQLVRGAAINGVFIPIMVSAFVGLKKEQIPHASIATRIFQTIGGAFGSAVLATVIDHQLSGSGTASLQTVAGAYDTAFWWAAGFCLAAVIPALLLSKGKPHAGEAAVANAAKSK